MIWRSRCSTRLNRSRTCCWWLVVVIRVKVVRFGVGFDVVSGWMVIVSEMLADSPLLIVLFVAIFSMFLYP